MGNQARTRAKVCLLVESLTSKKNKAGMISCIHARVHKGVRDWPLYQCKVQQLFLCPLFQRALLII